MLDGLGWGHGEPNRSSPAPSARLSPMVRQVLFGFPGVVSFRLLTVLLVFKAVKDVVGVETGAGPLTGISAPPPQTLCCLQTQSSFSICGLRHANANVCKHEFRSRSSLLICLEQACACPGSRLSDSARTPNGKARSGGRQAPPPPLLLWRVSLLAKPISPNKDIDLFLLKRFASPDKIEAVFSPRNSGLLCFSV